MLRLAVKTSVTIILTYPHQPLWNIKWKSAITKLTVHHSNLWPDGCGGDLQAKRRAWSCMTLIQPWICAPIRLDAKKQHGIENFARHMYTWLAVGIVLQTFWSWHCHKNALSTQPHDSHTAKLLAQRKKATIHQLTTMLATSKMSYFQVITTF